MSPWAKSVSKATRGVGAVWGGVVPEVAVGMPSFIRVGVWVGGVGGRWNGGRVRPRATAGLLVKLGPRLWLQNPLGPRVGVGLLVLVGEAVS